MVDLGRIKFELLRLSGPGTISMGADGLYDELKSVVKTFEDDPDFQKILADREVKAKTSKRSKIKEN